MQLPNDDKEMEQYLKQFQPRTIGPLKLGPLTMPPHSGTAWFFRLAVAAVVIFAGGFALWYAPRQDLRPKDSGAISQVQGAVMPRSRASTVALTELALSDSNEFDRVVAEESGAMFPSMQEEESALRVLAKE